MSRYAAFITALLVLSTPCTAQTQRQPISLGILVDASGNMGPLMDAAHEGLEVLLDTMQPVDEVFMMGFGLNAINISDFSSDKREVARSFDRFGALNSPATLHPALKTAIDTLHERGKHERKLLLIITVGLITDADLGRSRELIRESKVAVHSIGMPVRFNTPRVGSSEPTANDWAIQCERALKQFAEISNGSYAVVTSRNRRAGEFSVKEEFQLIANRMVTESTTISDAHRELSAAGRDHVQTGRFQAAVDTFLKIGQIGTLTAEDRYLFGVAFYKLDRTATAVGQLEVAVSLAPGTNPSAYLLLHNAVMKLQDPARGLEVLEAYLSSFPQDPMHEEMAKRAERLRGGGEAEKEYQRGLQYKSQGRRNEALRAFENAVKMNPGSISAKLELGKMYSELQEYEKAVDLLRSVVDAGNVSAEMYFHLGSALFRTDSIDAAEVHLERALQLDPDLDLTYLELYNLHMHRKEHGKALDRLEAYLKRFPNAEDRDYIITLAQELRRLLKRH